MFEIPEELKDFKVGDIVKTTKEMEWFVPVETLAVCFEINRKSQWNEYGIIYSFLFEGYNGMKYDGYGPEAMLRFFVKIGHCKKMENFAFKNMQQVFDLFDDGIFDDISTSKKNKYKFISGGTSNEEAIKNFKYKFISGGANE